MLYKVRSFFSFYSDKINLIKKIISDVGLKKFSLIAILSIIENFIDLITIGLIINILFIKQAFPLFNVFILKSNLNIYILLILVFIKSISKIVISILKNKMILFLNTNLREKIFSAVLNSPLDKIDNLGRSELLNTLRSDVTKTINSLSQFINLIQNIFSLIIYIIGFLLITNNSVSILLIGFLATFTTVFFQKTKSWDLGSNLNKINESIFKTITESIYGLKTIKSFSSEKFFLNKLSKDSKVFNNISNFSIKIDAIFNSSKDFVVSIFVVLWIFIQKGQVDSSLIIANLFLCYKCVSALSGIVKSSRNCLIFLPGYKSLLETRGKILFTPRKDSVFENVIGIDNLITSIDSLRCNFLRKNIIKNSDITLLKEKFIVLVGPSGSGKTTILDIICGLKNIEFSNWFLGINENCKKKYKRVLYNQLSKIISYSTQETYLFEGSLYENLTLGRNDFSSTEKKDIYKDIEIWLEKLGLNEISSRFESEKMNMNLITNCFSGGEIQRLGVIRNFLSNKPIEIYDEPTAYLDSFWSEKIGKMLFNRSKKKIIFVSSHDPKIIEKADQIIYAKDFFY